MRQIMFFLILPLIAYPQFHETVEVDELDDPDETQYMDQLLTAIFQPFSVETADSNSLFEHGYSREAIGVILNWQGAEASLLSLQSKIHGRDLILFKNDIRQDSQPSQIKLRQRLQYSPSLNGWRVLNKGRIWNKWVSVTFLSEQDPGESDLTDHSIATLTSQSIPWVDHLILGDFHVKWGGGLILNQQGSRPSLHPGSLLTTRQSTIRPHYSSRETDYYRGIASRFSFGEIQGSAFISSRILAGTSNGNQFKEDGDGIHPTGRIIEYRRTNDIGIALETTTTKVKLYGAAIYNPFMPAGLAYELGFSSELGDSQKIQAYTNSLDLKNHRIIGTWTYITPGLHVSLQVRHFLSNADLAHGATSTYLGSSASNEKGISVRTHLRPGHGLKIRYALDTGISIDFHGIDDYMSIQHHKVQVIKKLDAGVVQIDFSKKNEHPVLEGDIWEGQFTSRTITKGAVSLIHIFSSQVKYRVNLKSAFHQKASAVLVQQRVSYEGGNWKLAVGHIRFSIPDFTLRLSVYETSVAESFGFYTAYDDGDRWFLYLKQQLVDWFDMELKLVQTRSFATPDFPKQLALSFQMSIVL